MGSYQVSTPSFQAETADGKRRLTTVIARQVGQPGPRARGGRPPRRARPRGARRAVGHRGDARARQRGRGGRLKRTVTFVSTSGGSAGLGGARDLVQRLERARRRGARARRPRGHDGAPPLRGRLVHGRRRRRAAAAPDRRGRGAQGGRHQPGRRARDGAVGAPGLPGHDRRAGAAGGRRPSGGAAVGRRRAPAGGGRSRVPGALQAFGRAALRTLTALDNTPTLGSEGSPCPGHHAQGPARLGRPAARRRPAAGADAGRRRRLRPRAPPPRAGRPVGVAGSSRRRPRAARWPSRGCSA